LKYSIGNYNIPYLYFLALFSYLPVDDLYLIKLLSIFFDVLLAWAAMGIVKKLGGRTRAKLSCFFIVLFLPTVILNGALWGQCDSIYVALGLMSIYWALDDRPVLSMLAITLSFGFKLQAIFIMPVLAILFMQGKLKLKHFLIFPVAYVLLVLPAVLLGRPFLETITLYFSQTGSIGSGLNYNSPSIFAIFWNVENEELASTLAIAAAAVFMAVVLLLCAVNYKKLNNKAMLAAAVLLAVGIPFFLPHMHDRYFFAADILSVVLAFVVWQFSLAPLLVQFASLLGYHAYLKMRYLFPMRYGAYGLIAVMIMAAAILIYELYREKFNKFKFL
jgi:Gpi18-like mannosyltransferase